MPLVDITVEMGALTFASGSHKQGLLSHTAISDASQALYDHYVHEQGFPVVNQAMRAGDATFHSGWLAHSAPGNSSDRMREVMTIIYYADGVHVMTDLGNPARKADLDGIMPGVKPGDPAVSALTPLLYRR
jgi:ectoine hydroxylase-related dioxygenase (phytanoyl-CoA dioxygenase family)